MTDNTRIRQIFSNTDLSMLYIYIKSRRQKFQQHMKTRQAISPVTSTGDRSFTTNVSTYFSGGILVYKQLFCLHHLIKKLSWSTQIPHCTSDKYSLQKHDVGKMGVTLLNMDRDVHSTTVISSHTHKWKVARLRFSKVNNSKIVLHHSP